MSKKSLAILRRVRELCEHTLDYCDELTGCENCKLYGVSLSRYDDSDCPIHIISLLNDALIEAGVDDGRYSN